MRKLFLNNLVLVAMIAYAIVMLCWSRFVHLIVGQYGVIGGLLTIAAMYLAAVIYERRKAKADLDAGLIETTHFERLSERPLRGRD